VGPNASRPAFDRPHRAAFKVNFLENFSLISFFKLRMHTRSTCPGISFGRKRKKTRASSFGEPLKEKAGALSSRS
jgi:hypothetical protein